MIPTASAAASTASTALTSTVSPSAAAEPAAQQLALLLALPGGATPEQRRDQRGPRLSLVGAPAGVVAAPALPPQLRLDRRTRAIGRAGIAELRRILAEGAAPAA